MSVCAATLDGKAGYWPKSSYPAPNKTALWVQAGCTISSIPRILVPASEHPVQLIRDILDSKPSDQVQQIGYLRRHVPAVELVKAATALGTGSARMMVGSIVSEMEDAWTAWHFVAKGDFGADVISYIDSIFETPDHGGKIKSQTLVDIVQNYSVEVKEYLLDELAARDALSVFPELLKLLEQDHSEEIRDYALSLG